MSDTSPILAQRPLPSRRGATELRLARLRLVLGVLVVSSCWLLLGASLRARVAEAGAVEGNASGSESADREYQIKAVFLLNFIRYATWPEKCFEDEKSPVVLWVVGKDPFGETLEGTFRGERVEGRAIEVRRSKEIPDEIRGHIVYFAEGPKGAREAVLARCKGRPLLLIGESPGFAEEGACINFYLSEQKTRFEINTEALAEGGLVLSPSALKMARIVKLRRKEEG